MHYIRFCCIDNKKGWNSTDKPIASIVTLKSNYLGGWLIFKSSFPATGSVHAQRALISSLEEFKDGKVIHIAHSDFSNQFENTSFPQISRLLLAHFLFSVLQYLNYYTLDEANPPHCTKTLNNVHAAGCWAGELLICTHTSLSFFISSRVWSSTDYSNAFLLRAVCIDSV